MTILPEELCLHLTRFIAANGEWKIAVESVLPSADQATLFVNLKLEQAIDEERFLSRKLGLMVPASVILDPETCVEIITQIQEWIEQSEGEGFLDLSHPNQK